LDYYKQTPELAKRLFEFSQVSKKGSLGNTLLDLVNIRASQLNGCAFCLDMHCKEAKMHGERELRIYHVPIWRESTLFSEAERKASERNAGARQRPLDKLGVTDRGNERTRKRRRAGRPPHQAVLLDIGFRYTYSPDGSLTKGETCGRCEVRGQETGAQWGGPSRDAFDRGKGTQNMCFCETNRIE